MILTSFFSILLFLPQDTIPVPVDVRVWGGLSLALIFRAIVVPALLAFGVLKDDNKKTVGAVLAILGLLAGGIYSLFGADLNDPIAIITNLAAGGFAGFGAVGLHSSQKNLFEWLKSKDTK